jgi:N-acetylmuramoyl-L-alanine amidase
LGPDDRNLTRRGFLALGAAGILGALASCSSDGADPETDSTTGRNVMDAEYEAESPATSGESEEPSADDLRAQLNLTEDYRDSFVHGDKGPEYQKYIVLHDTEGDSEPESIVSWWDSNGRGIAAHFIVGKDGSIVQCVDVEKIAHHAGFGDTGHNELYGVEDESRDDKVGTEPIGDWASDYGMNSYSVGIEMVHVGGEGDYPFEQLDAVDALIAWIDAYFGFESTIIDHKAWRTGNSDTSAEFAGYLANYQDHRTHD